MKANLTPKICEICGKDYYRKRNKKTNKLESFYNFDKRRFCSIECYWKSLSKLKGESHYSYKARIKKVCPICKREFEVLPSRNKKIYCSRECVGLSLRGRKCPDRGMKRENNPAWKGGITETGQLFRTRPEYLQWRMSVLERDNYTCQACKVIGGKLIAHHIENFAQNKSKRIDIKNGVVLCKECHKEFHKIYGRENNTKEQLEEFCKTMG